MDDSPWSGERGKREGKQEKGGEELLGGIIEME
jgi:hypothetical protein